MAEEQAMLDQNGVKILWAQITKELDEVRSDVPDAYTKEETDNAISTALVPYSTTAEMNAAIAEAIGDVSNVSFEVVYVLPDVGEPNIIYLLPSDLPEEENIYDEYIWVNNKWEHVGNTAVDLHNYPTKQEMDDAIRKKLIPYLTGEETVQVIGEKLEPYSTTAEMNMAIDSAIADMSKPITDHRELTNRDALEQHPINAITGLTEKLNKTMTVDDALTISEILSIMGEG